VQIRETGAGVHEVLEVGSGRGPRGPTLTATVAALCLLLGSGAGAAVQRELSPAGSAPAGSAPAGSASAASSALTLSASEVTSNHDPFGGPRYVATLHNLGDRAVVVESVEIVGWSNPDTWLESVTVGPGSWATVPVHVAVDCGATAVPPDRLEVEGTVGGMSFREVAALPHPVEELEEDRANRCEDSPGRAPSARELDGWWVVEEGESLPGSILVHFGTGTLVLADGTVARHAFNTPRVIAGFSRTGSRLTARVTSGMHCRLGNRWRWRVTLGEDGRLRIEQATARSYGCREEVGGVWVAGRLRPATP